MSSPTRPALQSPGLAVRFAAMIYEAFLLFAVCYAAGFALLALLGWTYPLTPSQRWKLQVMLFFAAGAYFVYAWVRSGQTLAMKTWRLRVVGPDGRPPPLRAAVLRYVAAWTLFAPGLALAAVLGTGAWAALALTVAGCFVMLLPTLGPRQQTLHDRLSGTRLVRETRT